MKYACSGGLLAAQPSGLLINFISALYALVLATGRRAERPFPVVGEEGGVSALFTTKRLWSLNLRSSLTPGGAAVFPITTWRRQDQAVIR